ncbi:CopG family ribbon-helix-helix protein [Rhizobium sullae]|uniref:CopG family ribbon-helix-helix protein n=1 Tax=Rhizobium sullae TaxID=50338 RepID=UPI001045E338|nr:hypothetical protein [Rhizobium sullae]
MHPAEPLDDCFKFSLKKSIASRFDRLAEKRKLSTEETAFLLREEFVEREEWQVAEIEAAVREANAGEFASDDEANASSQNISANELSAPLEA